MTRLFKQIERGRGRHSAPPTLDRWVVWLISGAAAVIVLASATLLIGGGDEETSRPVAAAPSTELETPEPEVTEEPSPSPTVVLTPRRTTRPADLIVGLQATVDALVRDGQLSRRDGQRLIKRLREANQALSAGEIDRTRDELKGFSEKINELREDDDLSSRGYQTLQAGLQQIVQALPQDR